MKAITYSRLSVNRSGETLAIDRQQQDCHELIKRMGWELVADYHDDNRSAWHENTKRPGYDALREAIKRRDCDVVVVYETDRLARRLRSMLDLFDLLLETGVVVHSVKSGLIALDSPLNIANAQMKAVFAEQYVNDARDKNLRARAQLAEQGKRHMTRRPYGWKACGVKLEPKEAAIVRELTERLIEGETATAIAADLNLRGIPTIQGAKWTGVGVKACARRASNAGLRSHHGSIYQGSWDAIVTREQWERVCSVMSRPARAWRRGTGRKYPFHGYVRCAECGAVLNVAAGRGNSGYSAYRCDLYKSADRETRTGCGKVLRSQVPVDWLIREALIDRLSGEGLARAMQDVASQDQAVAVVLDELVQQRQRLDDLVTDYSTGLLDRAQFGKAKALAEARVRELERKAANVSGGHALKRADWSEGVRSMIEGANLTLLRDIAELLIERVTIAPMPKAGFQVKWVEIEGRRWRFDVDLIAIEWRV